MTENLEFKKIELQDQVLQVLGFSNSSVMIKDIIYGMIANFTPTTQGGRKKLQEWKRQIAIQINSNRDNRLNPNLFYAITIGMKFHPETHGNQELDLDNYSKPILDAIAAGLFSYDGDDLSSLITYNQFDDSNFRHIYLERLPDAELAEQESVAIFITQNSL
ncbi:MAG: RusA family crossover junction endodeoxyribonuclease [Nitrosopumilaceae archaeon]|nr:RusA family crossover junction endodeoxyribonuclease [Nitrosopumilaceae archaeon]